MNPRDQGPRKPRSSIRMDARLDATTRAKVNDLATRFRQPRAAVLCYIMQWGLSCRQTGLLDQGESEGPARHLYFYVACELRERVQKAATAAGMKIAPWLRHMVRQVTMADFPASWHEERSEERSHDSDTFTDRFILRLDRGSQLKLGELVDRFAVSKAKIIRQLIAQALPEGFPKSWHMSTAERHAQQSRKRRMGRDGLESP